MVSNKQRIYCSTAENMLLALGMGGSDDDAAVKDDVFVTANAS
ncbi:MAG: hypothetical protein ACJ71E_04175 [Nitrososphaeraceae archaeon]